MESQLLSERFAKMLFKLSIKTENDWSHQAVTLMSSPKHAQVYSAEHCVVLPSFIFIK